MTSHRDTARASVWRSIAWGRTLAGVLIGAAFGSAYSLSNRPVSEARPIERTAGVADRPAIGSHAIAFDEMILKASLPDRAPIIVADMMMLPVPPVREHRDVSLQPLAAPAGTKAPMAFRSIATLSAPSPRAEADARALKGERMPREDEAPGQRGTVNADAVAAVWGFLAVGLGGSTGTAGAPRSTFKQPR